MSDHVHTRTAKARIVDHGTWSRAIETCECGAYRTLDHSWVLGVQGIADDHWTEWRSLESEVGHE